MRALASTGTGAAHPTAGVGGMGERLLARLAAMAAMTATPLAGTLQTARGMAALGREERAPAAWSAALPGLAALLPAGLPRGELVELVAGRSAGRFATVLALLAAATAAGENAALVDLGDALDPQQAARAGIAWPRLLWARPRSSQEALAAAEALLGGGLPLVDLDLGLPPVPGGRGAEAMWQRLARAARHEGGLLLVASPYRAAGPAAAVVLELAAGRPRWSGRGAAPRLLDGLAGRLTLAKARGTAPKSALLRLAS